MQAIFNALYSAWNQVIYTVSNIRILDVIDILVIAFIIYKAIGFFLETRAGQLAKGIVVILVFYLFATWFNLPVLRWLLTIIVNSGLVFLVIVFQPELRRALERVGQSRLRRNQFFDTQDEVSDCIETVAAAAGQMSKAKVGALIVFERETQLGDIINSGTVTDAKPSVSFVNSIFFPNSPLHDGAVIVRDGKIYAAGCILPLSQTDTLSSHLGTRHRAAVGMSENSDAVILVVSEETGNISIATNGVITRDYTADTVAQKLKELINENSSDKKDGSFLSVLKRITPFKKNSGEDEVKNDEK